MKEFDISKAAVPDEKFFADGARILGNIRAKKVHDDLDKYLEELADRISSLLQQDKNPNSYVASIIKDIANKAKEAVAGQWNKGRAGGLANFRSPDDENQENRAKVFIDPNELPRKEILRELKNQGYDESDLPLKSFEGFYILELSDDEFHCIGDLYRFQIMGKPFYLPASAVVRILKSDGSGLHDCRYAWNGQKISDL